MKALKQISFAALLITALLGILVALGCAPSNGPDDQSDQSKKPRIGVLLPLSGDAQVWGESMKRGIDLAKSELEDERPSGPSQVELVYEDDQGLPRQGVSAAEKLISIDRIDGLIGVANSSVALAIIPIIERNDIVFVSGGASSPELSGANDLFFRTWPSDLAEAEGMARYSRELGIARVALLYINNEYGVGLREPFVRSFEELGGEVVQQETFPQEATDFRTQLLRIQASNPEAIYLVGNPREMGRCLRQAAELGLGTQFLSTSAFREEELLNIAGSAAEGVLFTDASYDTSTSYPPSREFLNAFREMYGDDPGMLAATGYDALRVLVHAIWQTDGSSQAIVEHLRQLEDFPGAAGPLTFDESGNVRRPVRISMVSGGEFVTKETLD